MVAKIVELLDVMDVQGQECLSRYHYLDADGVASPDVLVTDWINDVLPLMRPFQNTSISHIGFRVRQVYPTAELPQETSLSSPINGTLTGDPAADFLTYSIKWNLGPTVPLAGAEAHHIKKGGKHLPGITVNEAQEYVVFGGGINAMIAAWFSEVKDPGTDSWQLVVASFETSRQSQSSTPTTRTITKAGQSAVVTKYAPVVSATAPSVSTQNTRKKLRGRTG